MREKRNGQREKSVLEGCIQRLPNELTLPCHVERSETPPCEALPAKPEIEAGRKNPMRSRSSRLESICETGISTFGRLCFARGSFTPFRMTWGGGFGRGVSNAMCDGVVEVWV
jgi:hypothetical protein